MTLPTVGKYIMPTNKGIPGPYRFYFYSFDCNEPKHVHVRRERRSCKYWLSPVSLSANDGFPTNELSKIRRLVVDNLEQIEEAWNEHCGQ